MVKHKPQEDTMEISKSPMSIYYNLKLFQKNQVAENMEPNKTTQSLKLQNNQKKFTQLSHLQTSST
jgi:hypothetical protein